MSKFTFLKSDRSNIQLVLITGTFLITISILDVFLNSFFSLNLISFLPSKVSFLTPFIIGMIGLNLIRIEYSGNKFLDVLNKNINTSNFNAALTLLIIFVIFKAIPPSLSWMILDANISGDTKEACTGTGACWTYIKVWFRRFMYGMYPNEQHWRINTAFLLVIGLGTFGLFATEKMKKFFISCCYSISRSCFSICGNSSDANWKSNRNCINYNVNIFIHKSSNCCINELV